MLTVTLPYDIGTFVKVPGPAYGTIVSYCIFDTTYDSITATVSGYKEAWCGEYLLSEIEPITKEENEGNRI